MLLGSYLTDGPVEGPILLKISRVSSIILIIMQVNSLCAVGHPLTYLFIAISRTWDSNSTLITTCSWTHGPIRMPPPAMLPGVDLHPPRGQLRVPIRVYRFRAPTVLTLLT